MPFVHCLGESVGNAGAHTDQRGLLDAELSRDLIGGAEADAADVASQALGVLRNELDGLGAVGFVDAHRARASNAVAGQDKHGLADDLVTGPTANDALRPLQANPRHLPQAARLLLDDV